MTIKDLKVGMKVFIREDLKGGSDYDGLYFHPKMEKMAKLNKPFEVLWVGKEDVAIKSNGRKKWALNNAMIDWDKTEKLNNKRSMLFYDGTILKGQIDGQEIKVIRSPKDEEDLEKAVMMGLLKSLGYSFSDVKRLQNKVKTVWKPKFNQIYYYVEPYGEVRPTRSLDNDFDKKLFDFGNCFKTEEEAEQKAIKFRQLFKEQADVSNK